MRFCVQIRNGSRVKFDATGVNVMRFSQWHSVQDTVFDFDSVDMADKCLAQTLSTSRGADPKRKYACYLWTQADYDPEQSVEERNAEEKRAHEWRGIWVLVHEGYKRRAAGKYIGPETVTVHPRVLWAYLPGEKPTEGRDYHNRSISGYLKRENYIELCNMNEIDLASAR